MDSSEFRDRGKEMVDYIADYMDTLSLRRVTPEVEPGYLRELLPSRAPRKGEDFTVIMKDVERAIMPGVCVDFVWHIRRYNERFMYEYVNVLSTACKVKKIGF